MFTSFKSLSQETKILVGGFVVGMTGQLIAVPTLAVGAITVSLSGLAILIGVRIIVRLKKNAARRFETTKAALDLETRLHKHVAQIPRPHLRRRRKPSMPIDRQYLPVITSGGRVMKTRAPRQS